LDKNRGKLSKCKPDQEFLDELTAKGFICPFVGNTNPRDPDAGHDQNAVLMYNLTPKQVERMGRKSGDDKMPMTSFLFYYTNKDVKKRDHDELCNELTIAITNALLRQDTIKVAKKIINRVNEYSEWCPENDLSERDADGKFKPMDYGLTDKTVRQFIHFGVGKLDAIHDPENAVAWRLDAFVPQCYTSHPGKGYCYEAIVNCGFPACSSTPTKTIEDRAIVLSGASQTLLKTYDPASPQAVRIGAEQLATNMLDHLNENVLPHLTNNISKVAIASMRATCARLTEKIPFLKGRAENIEKMLVKFMKQLMTASPEGKPLSKRAKLGAKQVTDP
jgi:hypothetical protein